MMLLIHNTDLDAGAAKVNPDPIAHISPSPARNLL
jgi:hypothetical protein